MRGRRRMVWGMVPDEQWEVGAPRIAMAMSEAGYPTTCAPDPSTGRSIQQLSWPSIESRPPTLVARKAFEVAGLRHMWTDELERVWDSEGTFEHHWSREVGVRG